MKAMFYNCNSFNFMSIASVFATADNSQPSWWTVSLAKYSSGYYSTYIDVIVLYINNTNIIIDTMAKKRRFTTVIPRLAQFFMAKICIARNFEAGKKDLHSTFLSHRNSFLGDFIFLFVSRPSSIFENNIIKCLRFIIWTYLVWFLLLSAFFICLTWFSLRKISTKNNFCFWDYCLAQFSLSEISA